ncbi:MAG: hypothetical protein KBD63_02980, partial [Bacteriovoracaceae bacterium]|nr:hypothetical protein [Bacteriovoracaceae bacterium]
MIGSKIFFLILLSACASFTYANSWQNVPARNGQYSNGTINLKLIIEGDGTETRTAKISVSLPAKLKDITDSDLKDLLLKLRAQAKTTCPSLKKIILPPDLWAGRAAKFDYIDVNGKYFYLLSINGTSVLQLTPSDTPPLQAPSDAINTSGNKIHQKLQQIRTLEDYIAMVFDHPFLWSWRDAYQSANNFFGRNQSPEFFHNDIRVYNFDEDGAYIRAFLQAFVVALPEDYWQMDLLSISSHQKETQWMARWNPQIALMHAFKSLIYKGKNLQSATDYKIFFMENFGEDFLWDKLKYPLWVSSNLNTEKFTNFYNECYS